MNDLINKEVELYLDKKIVTHGTLVQSKKDNNCYKVLNPSYNDWFFKYNEVINIKENKIFIKFP